MAWICLGLLPLQITKKSAKLVTSRRSSTRMSRAFLDSAARTAVSHAGAVSGGAAVCAAVLCCCRMAKGYSYSYGTLKFPMRQLLTPLLSLGALVFFAGTPAQPAESPVDKGIELAQQELARVVDLVAAGALPRNRVQQAQANVEDAKDEVVLAHDLYGDLPENGAAEEASAEMIAAAQRRVDRQQARLDEARKIVAAGVAAPSYLAPIETPVAGRQNSL